MVKCHFTGKEEHPFKGLHLLKNDGNVEYYSSSKALKNALKLKRDKRKLKWTEAFHVAREKSRALAKEQFEKNKQERAEKKTLKEQRKSSKK
jgi:large subunit ribosomal protein L24e